MNTDELKKDYEASKTRAQEFCDALKEQLEELVRSNSITLGVPIECRIKDWKSISRKVEHQSLKLSTIKELKDFVGLRLILIFQRDLDKVTKLIEKNFLIIEKEDTSKRLGETQFGYQSLHYVLKVPKEWLAIPTYKDFHEFIAEIQVRTLSQHIWAAASHTLQYKQETSVPPHVRRSIYRVSALLETVDLEFERVLEQRDIYVSQLQEQDREVPNETLNVDLLAKLLDEHLPPQNKATDKSEEYSEILSNLADFGITTSTSLTKFIKKQLPNALIDDSKHVEAFLSSNKRDDPEYQRAKKGVFYIHTGLIRKMLEHEFGSWEK